MSGILLVTSLGGYLYYAIFVDEFSCKTWIYFLKRKDEVFKWFHFFKALVENQTGKKIKRLRTDNGIEYESNEFNDFCREASIKREIIVPYTPEQNGVAERKNRMIMEATHAMIYDQSLPKFLWGEAANTAAYVQNRSVHQALDLKAPEEVFTGKKPNVSHFRIFGCLVYFHVPKEKRNKFESSGKKGIFIGYSENSKAYRIYVPSQGDVEVIHDVTFDEDIALGEAKDLPISRKDNDDVVEKQDEPPTNEPMPNVDGPMDHINPPLSDSSTSRKDLYGSKIHSKMLKDMLLQEGHFTKVRSQTGIKGTWPL